MDVNKSENYIFKRLTTDLYPDLVYISKSAFEIDPGVEYYAKKNNTKLFGPENLGFIAYSESGEPAAFYGVYSQPMILDGVQVLAAQSGDTMTHKNHMGKGLFIKLAKMTYDLAKESGVNFIFGFPNNNSYPGFVKKLEWVCPYKLNEFRIKVNTLPLSKLAKKVKLFNPVYNLYRQFIFGLFSSNGKAFDSSVLERGIGGINRTSDFVRYKCFSKSFFRNVQMCSMWMKIDGFLFLGDIERNDKVDYSKLLSTLKKMCFWSGIDVVIFQCSPEIFLNKKLSIELNKTEEFYMGYLNLSNGYDPEKFKYVFADIDTF